MRSRFGLVISIGLALALLAGAGPARAAEFERVMAEANAHWRLALWYAQTENPGVAGVELEEFLARWRLLVDGKAGAAPPAYQRVPGLPETMSRIAELASRAAALLEAEEARTAHRLLREIGEAMAELRRRNGIVTFADEVIRLREAVDRLSVLIRIDEPLDAPRLAGLREAAGRLVAWVDAAKTRLPAELTQDTAFLTLWAQNEAGIRGLETALNRAAPALTTLEVVGLIRVIRSNFSLVFIRFG